MSFRLLNIPIEVQSGFLITALLFAFLQHSPTLPGILASMVVVFVAVLAHELGHALVSRAFGSNPQIVLHGFGGRTISEGRPLSRGKSILVTLAGPGAGFLLGLVALGFERIQPLTGLWKEIFRQIEFCTFGWGILNLVPVLPLDGGLVLRDILGPLRQRLTLILSGIFAAILTLFFLKLGHPLPGILFGISTYQSIRKVWSFSDFEKEMKKREEVAQQCLTLAQHALNHGRPTDAVLRAGEAMMLTTKPSTRDQARRMAAAAAIEERNGQHALEILQHLEQPSLDDDILHAQALDVAGEREAGFALLRKKVNEDPSGPAFEALLRGLVATEQVPVALELAKDLQRQGSVQALTWFAEELKERGEQSQGVWLFETLYQRTGEERFSHDAHSAMESPS